MWVLATTLGKADKMHFYPGRAFCGGHRSRQTEALGMSADKLINCLSQHLQEGCPWSAGSCAQACMTPVKMRTGKRVWLLQACFLPGLWIFTNPTGLKSLLPVFLQPREQMPREAELERGLAEVTLSQYGVEPNLRLELTQNLGFLQQAKLSESSHPGSRRHSWRILEWIQNFRPHQG